MSFNPDIHHRRSIRVQKYNYAQPGAYFITICTHDRSCLFGEIIENKMYLNSAGKMVQTIWNEIGIFYQGIYTDEFIIMPNHFHGIVTIEYFPKERNIARHLSLPEVMHRFKTMTTKHYINGVKQGGWIPFSGKLWQRNYWERIIRDESELNSVRQYIQDNPAKWQSDELFRLEQHPQRKT